MEAIAKTKHLKGSPRKARLVIDLIRGRNVARALAILKFTDKRAADPIAKTLRSAIANATNLAEKQNIAIDPDDLWVKPLLCGYGPDEESPPYATGTPGTCIPRAASLLPHHDPGDQRR